MKQEVVGELHFRELLEGKYYFIFNRNFKGVYPTRLRLVRLKEFGYHMVCTGAVMITYCYVDLLEGFGKKRKVIEFINDDFGFYAATKVDIKKEKERQKRLATKRLVKSEILTERQKKRKLKRIEEFIENF